MVAKKLNPLVDKLLSEMKHRKVKVPQFAEESGIPKDRVYKWKQEGTNPKSEDVELINNWINGESSTGNTEANKEPKESIDFKVGRLTGQLEEKELRREDAERFSDKLLETFKSNLTVLLGGQQVLYSFVRTILEYQAAKSNVGNMKMEELDLRSLRSMLVKNHLVNVTEEKALEVDKLGSNVDRP